jgi:L-ascorbate metabolism protein UlaG (beta-lactamase superfamily)
MMASDHFDGRRFFNPRGANGQPLSAVPRLIAAPRTPWPSHVAVTPQRPPPPGDATAVVTFIGHSSFLIQTPLGNLLTDPVYSERASPLTFIGPRRVREPGVRFDDLPKISVVLLSHNHYDHCDLRTLRALERRSRPLVVTPLGNRRLLQSAGVEHVEALDWWQTAAAAPFPITLTPAQHFSARTPFDRNRALWGGFVVTIAERRIFFAGDSGYAPHFREVRERLGPVALALLPIGAYEPRWFMKDIHMNPEEAVQAHLDLNAGHSIGMHFGTFRLTPEGIDEPVRALAAARRDRGVVDTAFETLESGASYTLGAGNAGLG